MFKRWWWIFLISFIAIPFLGLLTAGVIAYISPKKYESVATLQVRPPAGSVNHSSYLATEFEVISATKTLDKVIDELDLTQQWALPRTDVQQILKKSISTESLRGTDLIEIRFRHTSAAEAKAITQALTRSYMERRNPISRIPEVAVLRAQVAEQEAITADGRNRLAGLLESSTLTISPAEQAEAAKAMTTLQSDLVEKQTYLEDLKVQLREAELQLRLEEKPVIIHEDPLEARAPVSPNIPIILGIGVLAGLVGALILPFLIIPLLQRFFPKKTA